MISSMSEKISSFFVVHGIISGEDRDAYSYSFEVFIATLLNFIAVIVLAVTTRTIAETFLYLLAFIPLRQMAGGYHAKNHFRCFMILLAVYASFLTIVKLLSPQYTLTATMLCITMSAITIFILSPMEDTNKPFTEKQKKCLKKRSRIAVLIYISLTTLMAVFNVTWAFSLSLGVATIALSLVASAVKHRI